MFVGAGRLGGWETRFVVSNTGASELGVSMGVTLDFPGGCPITGCPGYQFLDLPSNGSEETVTPGVGSLDAIYIRGAEGDALPIVASRTVNTAQPLQVADVPGFRLSSLLDLDLTMLSFPNSRAGASRSNLVLTNLLTFEPSPIRGGDIDILVEAYAASGELLASTTLTISAGNTVFIPDVYEGLGGSGPEPGQIRATRIGGDRAFWGVLYTIDENGAVTPSLPVHF